MSFDQTYTVPSIDNLLVSLTGKTSRELLERELLSHGLSIIKTEEIVLDDGMYDTIKGERVYLSDGRVFEPKLVRRVYANGNWGQDIYEYKLQDEKVEVIDEDLSEPLINDCDLGNGGLFCGCDGEDC